MSKHQVYRKILSMAENLSTCVGENTETYRKVENTSKIESIYPISTNFNIKINV